MFTAIGELVVQDHAAVGQRGVAVAERHLDAVQHFSARYIGGNGKHVDGRDTEPVLFSVGKRSQVNTEVYADITSMLHRLFIQKKHLLPPP